MACLALAAAVAPAPAEAQTWNVTSGTWSTAGNWDGGLPATTGTAYFSSSSVTADATAILGAGATIGGLVFESGGGIQTTLRSNSTTARTLTIGSGGITVGSSSGNVFIGVSGSTVSQTLTASQTWTNNSTTGTLSLNGNRTTSGASPVTLTIAGDGRIEFANTPFSQGATATLSIVKNGNGYFLLHGNNTFTGGVTLNSGTLAIGGNAALGGAASVFTINGGSLDVTAARTTTNNNAQVWGDDFTFLGSNTLNTGTGTVTLQGAGTARQVTVNASTLTVGGPIVGAGYGLTKAGAGTLALGGSNSYTGNTAINAGTLTASSTFALGDAATNLDINGGSLSIDSAVNITRTGTISLANGSITTGTLTNNGVNLLAQSGTISSVLAGSAGLTKSTAGSLVLSGTNTYAGPTTISGGTLTASSNFALGDAAANLDINGGSLSISSGINIARTGTISLANGSITTGTLTNNGVNLLAQSGTISSILAGSAGLTKSTAGSLLLSSSNTFTGGVTLQDGLVRISNANALGATSGTLTFANGGLSSNSATAYGIANPVAFSGDATLGDATTTGILTFSGSTDLGGATRTLNLASAATFSGAISNGGIVKSGSGTLTLSAHNNPFSGGVTLEEGTLVLNGTNTLGTGTLTINGGSLNGTQNRPQSAPQVWNADFIWVGSNNTAFSGPVTLTGNRMVRVDASTLVQNGIISGDFGITKSGAGRLTLGGSNTFTGGVTLSQGTLLLNNASALGAGTFTISGGTLDSGAANLALATNNAQNWDGDFTFLGASHSLNLGTGAVAMNGSRQITVSENTLTVGGAISGAGFGLTKAGAGKLTLSAANTYTGTTSINSGTLALGSAGTFANSPMIRVGNAGSSGVVLDLTSKTSGFTFGSGQTVGGIGTINIGAGKTVTSNGIWAPGNSIGSNAVTGNLTLSGTSQFELGTPGASTSTPGLSDFTAVSGTLTLGGALDLIDNAGADGNGSAAGGVYRLFTYGSAVSGSYASVTANPTPTTRTSLANITYGGSGTAAGQGVFVSVYNLAAASVTSGTSINLGTVLKNTSLSQALAISNTAPIGSFSEGLNATFGSLTGDATTNAGSFSLLAAGGTSTAMTVGLGSATAGAKSGSALVNFSSDGAGTSGLSATSIGSQTVSLTATVLDPAVASFASGSTALTTLTLNFGSVNEGDVVGAQNFSLFNLLQTAGYTADLALVGISESNPTGPISTNLSLFNTLAGGTFNSYQAFVNTSNEGTFSNTWTLQFKSANGGNVYAGDTTQTLTLTANIVVVPEPGAIALAGIGIAAAAYALRSRSSSRKRAG